MILFILFILFIQPVYADRICIEKDTGKIIEYQSEDAKRGTLIKNAINVGYDEEEVYERYITTQEYIELFYEQVTKPKKEKEDKEEVATKQKETELKNKLKLSDKEWEDLKNILK